MIPGHARVFRVRRFWEKPNQWLAQVLQLRGCLWNSFVMVAPVRGLLEIIANADPDLYRSFSRLSSLLQPALKRKGLRISMSALTKQISLTKS